jgi:hypothetical protein
MPPIKVGMSSLIDRRGSLAGSVAFLAAPYAAVVQQAWKLR